MDGHEHVSLGCTRFLCTLRQRDEEISIAYQECLHACGCIDLSRKLARHRQGDVFLSLASGTDGARILSTMAGINCNHQRTHAGTHGNARLRLDGRQCRLLRDDSWRNLGLRLRTGFTRRGRHQCRCTAVEDFLRRGLGARRGRCIPHRLGGDHVCLCWNSGLRCRSLRGSLPHDCRGQRGSGLCSCGGGRNRLDSRQRRRGVGLCHGHGISTRPFKDQTRARRGRFHARL